MASKRWNDFPDKTKLYICDMEDARYVEDKLDFWHKFYGFDMSCVKKLTIMEPDTLVCDPYQIISDCNCILSVDIYTVKKEDLDFNTTFQLRFLRNDHCHALVSYFTIDLSKSRNLIQFTTGPRATYTHWKQTVFYLDTHMVVRRSAVLKGTIYVQHNKKKIHVTSTLKL